MDVPATPPETNLVEPLAVAATAALQAFGAEVRLFADADNCVRPRELGERCQGPAVSTDPARLPFVIEVQGVPNLFHELAHVVLLGRVAKDHATEYARIPFDLATPFGRARLFEELACCAASSAWHPGGDDEAHAWFDEQVGIQHCFFDLRHEPRGFVIAADVPIGAFGGELDEVCRRAWSGVERALRSAGAPDAIAQPQRAFPLAVPWQRLRAKYTPRA